MPDERPASAQFQAPAEDYDRFMGRYTPALATALADAAGIQPGMRVLDVGCGPGGLARELATRLGTGNVAAIDPAPQFAAACRDRNPGADVRTGVAEQLPWPAAHFDAALSSLVIGFLHDPGQGVREMARVTRPGGIVAACMWDIADGGMTMLRIFWTAARQVEPAAPGESAMAGTDERRHRPPAASGRPPARHQRRFDQPRLLRRLRRLLAALHPGRRPIRSLPAQPPGCPAGRGPRGLP